MKIKLERFLFFLRPFFPVLLIFLFLFLIVPESSIAGQEKNLLLCSFGSAGPSMPQLHRSGPTAGEFLVATRQLTGSIFSETVILIIEYGAGGAMGLIINRPTKAPISKLFPEVKELKNRQDPAFLGGPVEMYKAFLLLASRSKNPPGKSLRIFNQIYISADMNALKAAAKDPASRFRIYAGYAGWTSGQLESEINRGDWYILSADEKTLFDLPASEIWPELIGKSGIEAMNATGLLRLAYRLR